MDDIFEGAHIPSINSIIRNVTILNLSFERILTAKLAGVGKGDVSADYAIAFGALRRRGPMPISKLAERVERSIPYTTQMVREMQDSGYFERIKSTEDQRINAVALTPYGSEIAVQINDLIAEILAEKFSPFPPDEIRLLAVILARVTAPFVDDAIDDERSHLPT